MGLNIAMFTETFIPHANGVTTSILNARHGLSSRGHRVTVYSAGDPVYQNENVHYYGGKVFPLYPDFPVALYPNRYGPRNKRALKRQGADLIHIHAPGPVGVRGYRAARRHGLPFLMTHHTVFEPLIRYAPFGWKTFYRVGSTVVDRLLTKHCTFLIAPTKQDKRALTKKYPQYEEKIRIVPTGIDTDRFRPGLDATPIREAWGYTGNERVILWVGRLGYEKRVDVLLRAFQRLHQEDATLRFVLGGTGPAKHDLSVFARDLDLDGYVRFAGHIRDEDMPLSYNAADVFASASEFETQGLTLLEAMASGLPVAVAAAGGFLDFVRDGKNGYLFAPHSVDAAAHALRLALEAPPAMRQEARRTVLDYSLDRCCSLLEDAYREALDAGPAPR